MRKRYRITKATRLASLQQHYIRAREIKGGVLCLFSARTPTRRVYRAIVEVAPLNFLLKAEEEQDALVERYRSMLKALAFPLQMLLRHQRLDLRPYLARIQERVPHTSCHVQTEENRPGHGTHQNHDLSQWALLAQGLEDLLRQLGSRRTLIERHCYLVIPAPDVLLPGRRVFRRAKRRALREEVLARALQELDIRVEMVQHQLAALGVRSRRIEGEELARMYQSCLVPDRALEHPLTSLHLRAVGRVLQVQNHIPASTPPEQEEAEEPPLSLIDAQFRAFEDLTLLPASGSCEGDGEKGPVEWQRLVSIARARHMRHARHQCSLHTLRIPQACFPSRMLPPPDLLRLADVLAPASLEETHDALCIDGEWVRGVVITAFPREVSVGWLAPLLLHDDILDLTIHIHPQDQSTMMRQLRRRRVSYASTRLWNRRQGRLDDPDVDLAQSDVTRLMNQLASGGERIFEVSLVLLVRAPDRAGLDERTERLMAVLRTVFLDPVAYPTTFEHAQALRTMLPEGQDALRRTITLDSMSLATTFPFLSNSLLMPGGCLLGVTGAGEPVLLDPWETTSLENPHAFVGGVTGAGKSYLGKLWLIRSLLSGGVRGEHCSVIDPDGEYTPLAAALGGTVVRIAPGSAQHLNPFDLLPPGYDLASYLDEVTHLDRLAEKIQDLHALLDLMLADHGTVLAMREKALLDRALYEVYRRVGITTDPQTHGHLPPRLSDLADVLRSGECGSDDTALGLRLSRYTEGSLAGVLGSQTNVPLDSHLVVWDTREMRGDLRPVGIWLIADCLWTQAVYQRSVRRALYIDEAASLIEHPEGGRFLANLSRRARKRYLRLVTMTQSPERFVSDEWGGIVASNAATKILKLQDRVSVKAVASRFGLTRGEEQRLLAFGVREALLLAGDRRVLLSIHASEPEHVLITTNPVELAHRHGIQKEEQDGEIPAMAQTPLPLAARPRQSQKPPGHFDARAHESPTDQASLLAVQRRLRSSQETASHATGTPHAFCRTIEAWEELYQ